MGERYAALPYNEPRFRCISSELATDMASNINVDEDILKRRKNKSTKISNQIKCFVFGGFFMG